MKAHVTSHSMDGLVDGEARTHVLYMMTHSFPGDLRRLRTGEQTQGLTCNIPECLRRSFNYFVIDRKSLRQGTRNHA